MSPQELHPLAFWEDTLRLTGTCPTRDPQAWLGTLESSTWRAILVGSSTCLFCLLHRERPAMMCMHTQAMTLGSFSSVIFHVFMGKLIMPTLVQRLKGSNETKYKKKKKKEMYRRGHVSLNLRGLSCPFPEQSHPPSICSLHVGAGTGQRFPLRI